jgi:serine/threonine protein kinase
MTAAGAGVGAWRSTHYTHTAGAQGTAAGRPSISQGEAATAADDALAADPLEFSPAQTTAAGTGQEEMQDKGALHAATAAAAAVAATPGDVGGLNGCLAQISETFDNEMTAAAYDGVRLLECIGQGGYGAVYKGRLIKQQAQLDTASIAAYNDEPVEDAQGGVGSSCQGSFVAIKVFPPCTQPKSADACRCGPCCSFKRERSALKLLQHHPGAACVRMLALGVVSHDGDQAAAAAAAAAAASDRPTNTPDVVGSTGGINARQQLLQWPCVVLELASGTLEGTEQLSEEEASALMLPLVETLALLHSGKLGPGMTFRLIHRDIKPSNILLTRRGPVFCDFSCCAVFKVASDNPEVMYTRAGTELYMTPEVNTASDKGYTRDVDCYDLGLVAASLLWGGSAALLKRGMSHRTLTLEGWLGDFYLGLEVPQEQGVSSQARDFVRCCCLLRQRPVELLQHEWLRQARVAAHVSQLGPAVS